MSPTPQSPAGARHHPARSVAALLAGTAMLFVAGLAVPQSTPEARGATTTTSATPTVTRALQSYRPKYGFFGPDSEWTRNVTSAPLSSDSTDLVANLASQVATRYGGIAAFNVSSFNVGFVSVSPLTPRKDVVFDNCQGKPYTPSQLYSASGAAHFANVPIPDDAIPAAGSDGELTVWSPATDQLWEFWKAKKLSDGWHACWGGRIDSFSTSPGYFADGMGVAATGLSMAAGSIGIAEMQSGSINHAISLNVVDAASPAEFSYPAQRSDGTLPVGTPHAVWEGQRFRLDPTVDVTKLRLSRIGAAIAVAAQKYGFIVNDRGGAVAVIAESGAGVAKATGTDPWTALRAGTASYNVMKGFPWGRLQALPLDYGRP